MVFSTSNDFQVDTEPKRPKTDFALTVGELIVLRSVCPRNFPGKRFELIKCIRKFWRKDSDSWRDYARMLCDKGLLEQRGRSGRFYSVTDFGVEVWKGLTPAWKKAYQGAGNGWKKEKLAD